MPSAVSDQAPSPGSRTEAKENEVLGAFFARLDKTIDGRAAVAGENKAATEPEGDPKEALWWLLYGS